MINSYCSFLFRCCSESNSIEYMLKKKLLEHARAKRAGGKRVSEKKVNHVTHS